jgi:hypothetical protein
VNDEKTLRLVCFTFSQPIVYRFVTFKRIIMRFIQALLFYDKTARTLKRFGAVVFDTPDKGNGQNP